MGLFIFPVSRLLFANKDMVVVTLSLVGAKLAVDYGNEMSLNIALPNI